MYDEYVSGTLRSNVLRAVTLAGEARHPGGPSVCPLGGLPGACVRPVGQWEPLWTSLPELKEESEEGRHSQGARSLVTPPPMVCLLPCHGLQVGQRSWADVPEAEAVGQG